MGIFQQFPKGGIYTSRLYGSGLYPGPSGLGNFIVDGRAQNDPHAQAVISACSLSAGAQQNAAFFLIGALKFYSLWSKMTGLYGLAGGTAAAHAINWKSPGTYNITGPTWSSGVTHNSNGITGNGSTGYGDTGLAPSVIGQNSIHLAMYRRTAGNSTEYTIGSSDASTKNTYISARSNGNNQGFLNDNSGWSSSGYLSTGFFLGSRIASTGFSFFNGARKVKSVTATSGPPTTQAISIFALNSNGTLTGFSNTNLAFASIGSGLTNEEALNLSWIVQAYQTLLGRQV